MEKLLEDNYYPNGKKVPEPDRDNPTYGFEIELNPKSKYMTGNSYWTHDGKTNTSKNGKLESYTYKTALLDEFFDRVGNLMLIGQDGDNLELRSHPGTKSTLFRTMESLLKKPLKTVTRKPDNETGIHVHSDKRNYTPSELYRNMRFLCSKHEDVINLIEKVGRRDTEDGGYGYLPPFDDLLEQSGPELDNESSRDGIYLNSYHATHEFRLFKSTTNLKEAAACIDFVDALLWFSRNPRQWIEDAEVFDNFVHQNAKSFPYLSKVL